MRKPLKTFQPGEDSNKFVFSENNPEYDKGQKEDGPGYRETIVRIGISI